MSEPLSREKLREQFEASAQEYLRHLREERREHFMESTSQQRQWQIFGASFELVSRENPHVHAYGELLVQWRRDGGRVIHKIVPDNMVVVSKEVPDPNGSYDLPLQPARPFWVLEYVSKHNQRKDYEDSFDVYEQELEVPYYLIFYPETQDLSLYRYNGRYYVTVKPNAQERYPIPQIEIELALLDGCVRFWFHGRLLPLPAELQEELDDARWQIEQLNKSVEDERRRANDESKRADDAARRANQLRDQMAAMQAELDRLRRQQGG